MAGKDKIVVAEEGRQGQRTPSESPGNTTPASSAEHRAWTVAARTKEEAYTYALRVVKRDRASVARVTCDLHLRDASTQRPGFRTFMRL
jgi:hypothetical protein